MVVRFTALGRPTPKGGLAAKWYPNQKVGLFYPPRVKRAQKKVAEAALEEMRTSGYPVLGARVIVHAKYYIKPTSTGRLMGDVDKLDRLLFDAMTGVVFEDDELVVGGSHAKVECAAGEEERTEVSVSVWQG